MQNRGCAGSGDLAALLQTSRQDRGSGAVTPGIGSVPLSCLRCQGRYRVSMLSTIGLIEERHNERKPPIILINMNYINRNYRISYSNQLPVL